jgi:transcriptional regulator with XRE-family HTH domain
MPDPADRARLENLAKEARRAFGVRIREARRRLGITQEALGAAIGLTSRGQSHVSRIELGYVNLTIESLVLISEALGFELDIVLHARQDGTVNQAQSE